MQATCLRHDITWLCGLLELFWDFIKGRVTCRVSLNSPWRTLVASVAWTDIDQVQVQAVVLQAKILPPPSPMRGWADSNLLDEWDIKYHSSDSIWVSFCTLVISTSKHPLLKMSASVVTYHCYLRSQLRYPHFLAARLPQTALTHGATLVPNGCRTKPAQENLPESDWDDMWDTWLL